MALGLRNADDVQHMYNIHVYVNYRHIAIEYTTRARSAHPISIMQTTLPTYQTVRRMQ